MRKFLSDHLPSSSPFLDIAFAPCCTELISSHTPPRVPQFLVAEGEERVWLSVSGVTSGLEWLLSPSSTYPHLSTNNEINNNNKINNNNINHKHTNHTLEGGMRQLGSFSGRILNPFLERAYRIDLGSVLEMARKKGKELVVTGDLMIFL